METIINWFFVILGMGYLGIVYLGLAFILVLILFRGIRDLYNDPRRKLVAIANWWIESTRDITKVVAKSWVDRPLLNAAILTSFGLGVASGMGLSFCDPEVLVFQLVAPLPLPHLIWEGYKGVKDGRYGPIKNYWDLQDYAVKLGFWWFLLTFLMTFFWVIGMAFTG